jgi:hypothetical protein
MAEYVINNHVIGTDSQAPATALVCQPAAWLLLVFAADSNNLISSVGSEQVHLFGVHYLEDSVFVRAR